MDREILMMDHLLVLVPWSEQPLDEFTVFAKIEFWVQIFGFPDDWYSYS